MFRICFATFSVALSLCVFSQPLFSQDGIITTVAGNGHDWDWSSQTEDATDGGPATQATIINLSAMLANDDGSFLFADEGSSCLRRVSADGIITTFGGKFLRYSNGFPPTDSGDGGPATNARFNTPQDMVRDSQGNIFVSDHANMVRKIDAEGIITLVAGNGSNGSNGTSENYSDLIFPIRPPLEANFGTITGLAIDRDDNLYIVDYYFGLIWKLSHDELTVFAGKMQSDKYDHQVSSYGGLAFETYMAHPSSILFGPDDALYVLENDYKEPFELAHERILKVKNGLITVFAGSGPAGFAGDGGPALDAEFFFYGNVPPKMSFGPNGDLYVPDGFNRRVRRIDIDGNVSTVFGIGEYGLSGDGGLASQAGFCTPAVICVAQNGDIFVGDPDCHVIRRVSSGAVPVPTGDKVVIECGGGVVATFDTVMDAGNLSFNFKDIVVTQIPDGFAAMSRYAELNTTATFEGWIWITWAYDPNLISGEETDLKILHFNGESWQDATFSVDPVNHQIIGQVAHLSPFILALPQASAPFTMFLRGDANGDGQKDISDPITILGYLFTGGVTIHCLDAVDVNDSGDLDISDAIFLLGNLFSGTSPIPPPGPKEFGLDPTFDSLGCNLYAPR